MSQPSPSVGIESISRSCRRYSATRQSAEPGGRARSVLFSASFWMVAISGILSLALRDHILPPTCMHDRLYTYPFALLAEISARTDFLRLTTSDYLPRTSERVTALVPSASLLTPLASLGNGR